MTFNIKVIVSIMLVLAIAAICGGLAPVLTAYAESSANSHVSDDEVVSGSDAVDDSDFAVKIYSDYQCSTECKTAPVISAGAAVVIDADSGRILYEKNALTKRAMASTTKMITAILAIEKGNLSDNITISKRAASIGGSSAGFRSGEAVSLYELLYALLLNSANDASIAIAEHIGGTVENFCGMMDKKADEIGAKRTAFKSPHGLDSTGHFSTPYDLALIARYALQNPFLATVVSTKSIQLEHGSYYNTNEMLGNYQGANGVKTGYTGKAGRCLVASAEKDGRHFISVVLNCATTSARMESTKRILDYAFETYSLFTLSNSGEFIKRLSVKKGISNYVDLVTSEDARIPLRSDEVGSIRAIVNVPGLVTAPVAPAETIGNITYLKGNEELAIYPLKAAWEVKRKNILYSLEKIFSSFIY